MRHLPRDHFNASPKDTGNSPLSNTSNSSYVSFQDTHILVVVIYRPGSKNICFTFFTEFSDLLTSLAKYTFHIIIVGNINIHLYQVDDNNTKKLQRLLAQNNLTQLVISEPTQPTHQHCHTLDVVITSSSSLISNMHISPPSLSDQSTSYPLHHMQLTHGKKFTKSSNVEHTPTPTSHPSVLMCSISSLPSVVLASSCKSRSRPNIRFVRLNNGKPFQPIHAPRQKITIRKERPARGLMRSVQQRNASLIDSSVASTEVNSTT